MSQKKEAPKSDKDAADNSLRERLWRMIFQSETVQGKIFDVVLLWLIGISVLVVMLESVQSIRQANASLFRALEWGFTIVFSIEYLVRLWVVKDRGKYAFSFFGMVDLMSVLPTYLELLLHGTHYLMVVRILRLLRMFRILKMAKHVGEAGILMRALLASRHKIGVFLFVVMTIVCVEGTLMYLLEQAANPDFNNIPQSIYWAIVTITTVGYGDMSPVTVMGKFMASVIMLTGFSIIAVPTGVVTAELTREIGKKRSAPRQCETCGWTEHEPVAKFCNQCGTELS